MINYLKKIFPWILPEKIVNIVFRVLISLKNSGFFLKNKVLLSNRLLKGKYKGSRCFIIGNGPSLNMLELAKLKNEYVFSMNMITKHRQLEQINPSFHSEIEPIETMSAYSETCEYHPDNYYKQIEKAFCNLNTILFFRYDCKDYFDKKGLFKDKQVFYLQGSTDFNRDAKYSAFSCSDISRPYSFMANSFYNAICCCSYLGFTDLYLIGFDADYILKNSKLHFYEEPEIIYKAGIKPYFLSEPKNESNKELARHLYEYLNGLELIKKYFGKKGVRIYNAGVGGFVDTFDRVDFEKLF